MDNRKFLIVGIGVNIVTNPNINKKYLATNILTETNKNPKIREIIDLIVFSYEKFFINLGSYDYLNFKKRAESLVAN